MAADLERLARDKGLNGDTLKVPAPLSWLKQHKLGRWVDPNTYQTSPVAAVTPLETPARTEQLTLRESFTDVEKKALIANGALIYTPLGETITVQRKSRAKKGKPFFAYLSSAENRLVAVLQEKLK